jgi:hypothetical protein
VSTQPDFNPQLKQWQKPLPTNDPGAGAIEQPGQYRNIVWQTRTRAATEHELQLAQALERAFGNGASEVADLVEQLNDIGVYDYSGKAWTEVSFHKAIAALGY